MAKIGLVLEGGGMRGGYTAGVLDALMDAKLTFSYCIGVSAGACNALSFIAKQRKRYFFANTRYLRDKRYMSASNFFKTGYPLGNRFIFDDITFTLVPLDIAGFERETAGCPLTVVTTDVQTGQPLYDILSDVHSQIALVEASSSLPFISPIVEYNGIARLDGGISDSIPVRRALADGCDKLVIILTQDESYRKGPNKMLPLLKLRYGKYPNMLLALKNRHLMYNAALEDTRRLEQEGRAFVIRPKQPVTLGRMERDPQKIEALYETGYQDGMAALTGLQKFMLEEESPCP